MSGERKDAVPPVDLDLARRLDAGAHDDPFAVLGLHHEGERLVVRALVPGAERVEVVALPEERTLVELERVPGTDVFAARVPRRRKRFAYRLRCRAGDTEWSFDDPYRYPPVLGEVDEYLISEGSHFALWKVLGAHPMHHAGADGVHFAVWAPNASRVSVVGEFNFWNGRCHVMRRRGATGVWEIFIPGLTPGRRYKYEIRAADGHILPLKADPVGFGAEVPPANASVIRDLRGHEWRDARWIEARAARQRVDAPMAIYEVHLGSWRRRGEDEGHRPLSYLEHAAELVPYAAELGFTHLELLPISEHPFGGSWGYQPIGLFAPTARFGTAGEFRELVEACHAAGLGLVLDWVPAHFPTDEHGLGRFDGTALYEHGNPLEGFHPDWNTLIYNLGRREVANYLVANALYWLEEYHVDGLRVDAVASMLYRDYSREAGQWVPNVHGGRENLEAVAFLERFNEAAYRRMPGILTAAEESTAWPGVSHPVSEGGLGFGYKWNMGWMNDTLEYMRLDPIHRRYHHHKMTFGLVYAFSENFILPISHDEVVHGKGSMLGKMPGDGLDQFANLRAYYGFMWGHPGKKLLFMGQEFAQGREWNHDAQLDWGLLDQPLHAGMQRLVRDLNHVYRETPALHQRDCHHDGFRWVCADDADESVYAWLRYGEDSRRPVLVVSHMTPVPRPGKRIGVPLAGEWRELINTDAEIYGGGGQGNLGGLQSEPVPCHGHAQSLEVHLPPLSTLMFEYRG